MYISKTFDDEECKIKICNKLIPREQEVLNRCQSRQHMMILADIVNNDNDINRAVELNEFMLHLRRTHLEDQTVAKLKYILRKRGMCQGGRKEDLINRIIKDEYE
jgi:hypothetical protein